MRRELHDRVIRALRSIQTTKLSLLKQDLDEAEQLYIDLRRHGAYLKVRRLENTDDYAIRRDESEVETDESALDGAVAKRLLAIPKASIASLGRFARLAGLVRREGSYVLSSDVESYRGKVTLSVEEEIADEYDRQLEPIGKLQNRIAPVGPEHDESVTRMETAFELQAPVTAVLLAVLVSEENKDSLAQGYAGAVDRVYRGLELTSDQVDKTLAALEKKSDVNRAYEQLRATHAAQLLGLSEVRPTDLASSAQVYEPLGFPAAQNAIIDGLRSLGGDYTQRLAGLLDPANGRLDLAGGEHRANTGTSISVYDAPVALYFTTFDGTLNATRVLAHEGGHAIHRELMNAGRSPIYEREGPHYVFEAFAELNELLVLDRIAETTVDPKLRIAALEVLTRTLSHDLFEAAEEAKFERSLYSASLKQGLLRRSDIDQLWRQAAKPYEIWPSSEVGSSRNWMSKSLLFEDPLYMVNYVYATIIAASLFETSRTDPAFAAKYNRLLRQGFTNDAESMLMTLGVDLSDPELCDKAVSLLRTKTQELEQAYSVALSKP